jgi:long-chain acyl-CoA synthetase
MMVEVSVTTPPSPATSRPGSADEAAPGIGRIAAWLSKVVELSLASVDLSMPQYRVLAILAGGSAAASGLAKSLDVRPPSVTALIDGLVARGLVDRRQEDSDRRRVALRITEEGTRVVAEADIAVNEQLAHIAAYLPSKDEVMALRALELWGKALAEAREARNRAADVPAGGDGR